ncbi:VPLPA-CTERM sorting domain-containing protein [Meridianimarinicoccus aquatilis]|uniref:VPLPA-CTERM sorting domain-containing protein n=1 Tax=Meridianimarinicoccus aquatilis TaxID=2552766 RepID=A0A4R6B364_9RHOB|nr:VPLPA-CTERM sorting domain-containing protein [Fluviibacterium aquatile]QIE42375.1 VPLPA-CTERM sorting domain-containing protein [Rhodobacteraceae bacterium SC52]TDL91227.1 VPLPA-CTERM sorting domain-containing protein [Fluviibacterium aquatile]
MFLTKSLKAAALASVVIAAPIAAKAASYVGEFWDASSSFSTIAEANAFADSNTASGTFVSTAIDYPAGSVGSVSDSTSLEDFLGVDFASYVGTLPTSLSTSVLRVSGTFLPGAGLKTYSVGSDDGFSLMLNGTQISSRSAPRGFGYTAVDYDAGAGPVDFVLTYYENGGFTGVEFNIDGVVVDNSIAAASVPVPAALPLLAAGLGALGLWGRRKSA